VPIGPVATTYPLSENATDALIEVVLDGVVDEWHGVAPIWYEAGVVGQGPSKSGIDIYHVYMTNDSENLYLFFCTRISLQARYDNTPTSGELCDLYFDTDNDPRTGCQDVDGFDFGKISGYELKAWIPVGVYSKATEQGPYISYDLLRANGDGEFVMGTSLHSESSQDAGALITHGSDGVEMAIPLESLGAEPGSAIRLLIKEAVDPFAKERYSAGSYTLR
jgi:hypothetical protein